MFLKEFLLGRCCSSSQNYVFMYSQYASWYHVVESREQHSSSSLVLVSVGYAAFVPIVFAKGRLLPPLRGRCVLAKSMPIFAAFKMNSSNTNSSSQLLESTDRLMLEKRIKDFFGIFACPVLMTKIES